MTNKSALGLGLIIYVGYAFVLIGLFILLLEAIKE